jgi:hypothetical protein
LNVLKIVVYRPFLLQHLDGARSYGWLNFSGERCTPTIFSATARVVRAVALLMTGIIADAWWC